MVENPYDKFPEADVIVKYINSRFRKGLNTNILVIGLSGTGKSSTTIRIPELVVQSRTKKPKFFLVDSLLGLLDAIKQAERGDLIGIEEISVLFPSRRAMAKDNVAIGKIFDTIRKKELCLISNAPLWNSIDSHIKAMMHVLIQTETILKTYNVVLSRFYRLQANPSSGKIYTHTMLRRGKEVNKMFTRMPDKERWDEYERRKDIFLDSLYEHLKKEALKKKEKEYGSPNADVSKLTERELQVHLLYNLKKMNTYQIAEELKISQQRVWQLVQKVIKKTKNPLENKEINLLNQPELLIS